MKLHPATVLLPLLQHSTNLQTVTSQTCDGVSGSFKLTGLSGTCSYAKLLEAYTHQVFDATGSTCQSGSELTAKQDFDAKLIIASGGKTPDEAAKSICKAMYDDNEVTPFYAAADKGTDYHFEQMFYNGLSEWQDEVETVYETYDQAVTSRLQTDAAKVKEFYNGLAKYSRVSWPNALTNFEASTCSSNAAMCCWPKDRQANDNNGNCATPYDENCVDKDPADNTNLCFADLKKGNRSSGFNSELGFVAFPEDNSNGEGAIHCHGFAWANDEYDPISRYKGNNLFYVSMYDHMHQRGYVKNIPGMPMCGCMDQMPMVTRSDCTQLDLTEEWEAVYEDIANSFVAKLTKVEIAFNACRGRNGRNNDLWAYAARLYDEGRMTPKQFGKVGRVLTDDQDCYHQVEYAKQQKGYSTGYAHDESKWQKVAGRNEVFSAPHMGRGAFNTALIQSDTAFDSTPINAILLRVCADCVKTHKRIFYKRKTAIPLGFDLLSNILYYSNTVAQPGNVWGSDFDLFSSYEDAKNDISPWKCPGNVFNYWAPFTGNCSPSGAQVDNQHTVWNWGHGPRLNVAYYVNKPESMGVQLFSSATMAARVGSTTESHTDVDIGRPYSAGVTYVDGAVTYIKAHGTDIWGQVDVGRFLSEQWEGDIDISVRVKGITNPSNVDWSKFGIMLRADNTDDAANAFLYLAGKQGINAQIRAAKNGNTNHVAQHKTSPVQTSAWLRIVKKMETIEFYRSDDGIDWVKQGESQTIFFPDDKYRVGLAVGSGWGGPVEGTFDNYNVEEYFFPSASPSISLAPTAWDPLVDIGKLAAQPAGQFVDNGALEIIKGSGTGIWGSNDSFTYYNTQEVFSGGGSVEMNIKRFNPYSSKYARGGLMLRDTRDSNASNVFLGAGRSGVTFQSRLRAGARTVSHNYMFTNWDNAMWVKLVYANDGSVEAFYKMNDTDAYVLLGATMMEITGDTVQVGRAVSAGTDYQWALEEVQTQSYQFIPATIL